MAFVTVSPPPGIYRSGTIYQAKNRWWDANLMRPREGQLRPIKGWQKRSAVDAFVGLARAVLIFRDNSKNNWIGIGTHSHLYVQDEAGVNHDITPTGLTVGMADATQNFGYGGGVYGTGFYGVPRPATSSFLPATTWDIDTFGQFLVGCSDADGKLYQWTPPTTGTAAQLVTGAPTGCTGMVVTQDGFVFMLGTAADGRRVTWCDQQNLGVWTAAATNQAGDYDLPTAGTLQCGRAIQGGAFLLTDVDAWVAQYINTPLVYGFQRVGSGCGPIGRRALLSMDSTVVWMGRGVFWYFNGQSVVPLDCEARDAVFGNLNVNQQSKITAAHLPDQGEVWWYYPSAGATECDSYIVWCYRESQRLGRNVWMIGKIDRTCGDRSGILPNPVMISSQGFLYEHETGLNYDGAQPFIETGIYELGNGDTMMELQRIIPDASADGDVAVTLYGRDWPDSGESVLGTATLTSPTDLLVQAREMRARFDILSDSAIGSMRVDLIQGDPI